MIKRISLHSAAVLLAASVPWHADEVEAVTEE